MVHHRPHSSKCKHIPAYFFKLILSSKHLICVLFNVYLNKKEMNNFFTNLVKIHQIIIKYDNATYIFTKALTNDVPKIEIFVP